MGVSRKSGAFGPRIFRAGLRLQSFLFRRLHKKGFPPASSRGILRYRKFQIMKIEHLGIAVKSLGFSDQLFEKLLGKPGYKQETVEREGVTTSFYKTGDSKIELLEATNPESPVSKFIEKRGEGIHHIAFGVENIYDEIERLKNEGFIFISEEPKDGADNKLVVFLHPKSTNGILVELCQEKP